MVLGVIVFEFQVGMAALTGREPKITPEAAEVVRSYWMIVHADLAGVPRLAEAFIVVATQGKRVNLPGGLPVRQQLDAVVLPA